MALVYFDGIDSILESLCRGCGGIFAYVIEGIILFVPFLGIVLLIRWVLIGKRNDD